MMVTKSLINRAAHPRTTHITSDVCVEVGENTVMRASKTVLRSSALTIWFHYTNSLSPKTPDVAPAAHVSLLFPNER